MHLRGDVLNLWAAHAFFSRPAEPDVRVIYGEVIDDLYNDLWEAYRPRGVLAVREKIKAFALPQPLQHEWNSLVVSTWILENHNRPHNGYACYEDVLATAVILHKQAYEWTVLEQRKVMAAASAQDIAAVAVAAAAAVSAVAAPRNSPPPPQ